MTNLTKERLYELLTYNPDNGQFNWVKRNGNIAGTPHKDGYVKITVDGSSYLAHRLAWLYQTGEWPVSLIDHYNKNRSDNRWSNIRQATRSQNRMNSKTMSTNKLGIKNISTVTLGNTKWYIVVIANSNTRESKTFPLTDQGLNRAVLWRDKKLIELHEQFASF